MEDLGSTQEQFYGAVNTSPSLPGSRLNGNPFLTNASFRFDDAENKARCYRFESNLCARGFNRDIFTATGGVILGSLTCTGLTAGALINVCFGGGLIAYAYFRQAAVETRFICRQNALSKCYGADAY